VLPKFNFLSRAVLAQPTIAAIEEWLVSFKRARGTGSGVECDEHPTPEFHTLYLYRRIAPRRVSGASIKRTGTVMCLPLRTTSIFIVSPT